MIRVRRKEEVERRVEGMRGSEGSHTDNQLCGEG